MIVMVRAGTGSLPIRGIRERRLLCCFACVEEGLEKCLLVIGQATLRKHFPDCSREFCKDHHLEKAFGND